MTDLLIREWERIVEAFEKEEIIQCTVLRKIGGGFRVRLGETIKGFLQDSQAPFESQTPEEYVGMEIPVKIVKLGRHRSIVVSGKYAELKPDPELKAREADWHKIAAAYKNKDTVEGIITEVTESGLKVKIYGIEARLPVDEIENDPATLGESVGKTYRSEDQGYWSPRGCQSIAAAYSGMEVKIEVDNG